MQHRRTVRLLASAAALLLLATACSDSGGNDPAEDASGSPSEREQEGEATAKGISDGVISLGVPGYDVDAIAQAGANINLGDPEVILPALEDWINDEGGILGHEIEVSMAKYNFFEPTSYEAACVTLAQDQEHFAVLTTNKMESGNGANLTQCLFDNDLPIFGTAANASQLESATVPFVGMDVTSARRYEMFARAMDAEGHFDDAEIAVVAQAVAADEVRSELLPVLEQLGHEVQLIVNDAPEGDAAANDANWDVFAERIASDGIDHVIFANTAGGSAAELVQRGYDGVISTDYGDILGLINSDEIPAERLNGYIAATGPTSDERFEHPDVQACISAFEERVPDAGEVVRSSEVAEGEVDWASTLLGSCEVFLLFKQVAETAGELTPGAMFEAVTQEMGQFSLGGFEFASFGPDKFDGNDSIKLAAFDASIGADGGLRDLTDYLDVG